MMALDLPTAANRHGYASLLTAKRTMRIVWLFLLFGLTCTPIALGQGAGLGPSLGREPLGNGYPNDYYYRALEVYRTGELDRAMDAFDFAIGRTRRDVNGHWIDAIPVYAMLGECQYQQGDLEGAMQSFDIALKIVIRYRGWLQRPVWEEVLRTQARFSPKQYLWPEANAVNRLPVSRAVKFVSGEQLTEARLALGGRIEELNIKTIDVIEILRGVAIASYRRRIIMGPLSEGDSLATGALDSTKYPNNLPSPIARSLIGCIRAAERFGAMNDQRCIEDAAKSAIFNGGVHPVSPIAGLSAASAMAGTANPAAAIPLCLAVANQAASMDHFEWIGEALQIAAGCANESQAGLIQQAGQVAATNLLRKSRFAALHCLLASADAAVTAGDLNSAMARLGEAKALSMRRDVLQPRLDAYGAYIAARISTRTPSARVDGVNENGTAWDEPMSAMMSFATKNRMRKRNLISMPRLYQLQRVRLALGRNLAGQSADSLLEKYAAPPGIEVWRRDPVDAIAGNLADRDSLRLSRLRTAASRESAQDVLMRLEDLLAGRFQQQLALGGRVFQTRALAWLPDELLQKKTLEARNKAAKPIRDLRAATSAAIPLQLDVADAKLAGLETNAWSVALDRHDLPRVIPQPMDPKKPVAELPDEVGVLAFFFDNNLLHAVLCTKQKSTYWNVKGAGRFGGEIAKVLRGIGATKGRGGRLPDDQAWRTDAIALRDRLIMPGTGTLLNGRLQGLKKLVVIPDGLLWYLPMEILPVDGEDSSLLGDSINVTYAASPALALKPTGLPSQNPVTAITTGKFFAPREMDTNESMVQSIIDALDDGNSVRLPQQQPLPTMLMGEVAGHVVVAEPTTPNSNRTLDTPLASHEASTRLGQLRAWLGFPGKKPSTVMLAGFRSNVDSGRSVSGAEVFSTLAALQYSGASDVVLSRWAVGGESTRILLREYVQELPFIGAGKALRRATNVLRRSELSPQSEPTLSGKDLERETLTGDEPFFWSSYLHASPITD